MALEEMKIIYAYKFFEINVKKLISTVFPDVKDKELYKWDSLLTFLSSKNIRTQKLDGYKEVNQLREVNGIAIP